MHNAKKWIDSDGEVGDDPVDRQARNTGSQCVSPQQDRVHTPYCTCMLLLRSLGKLHIATLLPCLPAGIYQSVRGYIYSYAVRGTSGRRRSVCVCVRTLRIVHSPYTPYGINICIVSLATTTPANHKYYYVHTSNKCNRKGGNNQDQKCIITNLKKSCTSNASMQLSSCGKMQMQQTFLSGPQ